MLTPFTLFGVGLPQGNELGYFQFGGSTIALLFQKVRALRKVIAAA